MAPGQKYMCLQRTCLTTDMSKCTQTCHKNEISWTCAYSKEEQRLTGLKVAEGHEEDQGDPGLEARDVDPRPTLVHSDRCSWTSYFNQPNTYAGC